MGLLFSGVHPTLRADLMKTIIRDLWELRLSKLSHRLDSPRPVDFESQAFSTAEDSGDDGTGKASKGDGKGIDSLKLVETISLCYLGILLLRRPVGLAELYRLVSRVKQESLLTMEDGSKKEMFYMFEQFVEFLLICEKSCPENTTRSWTLR